jgi:hypothetical protein
MQIQETPVVQAASVHFSAAVYATMLYCCSVLQYLCCLAHLQAMITSCPRCSSCRATAKPIPAVKKMYHESVQGFKKLCMLILQAAGVQTTCISSSDQAQPPRSHVAFKTLAQQVKHNKRDANMGCSFTANSSQTLAARQRQK